jgi:hypothetical protein
MLGRPLALNPHGLRDLILADRSRAVALGLLLSGFLITFGSVTMGTAIMQSGNRHRAKGLARAGIGGEYLVNAARLRRRTATYQRLQFVTFARAIAASMFAKAII